MQNNQKKSLYILKITRIRTEDQEELPEAAEETEMIEKRDELKKKMQNPEELEESAD